MKRQGLIVEPHNIVISQNEIWRNAKLRKTRITLLTGIIATITVSGIVFLSQDIFGDVPYPPLELARVYISSDSPRSPADSGFSFESFYYEVCHQSQLADYYRNELQSRGWTISKEPQYFHGCILDNGPPVNTLISIRAQKNQKQILLKFRPDGQLDIGLKTLSGVPAQIVTPSL